MLIGVPPPSPFGFTTSGPGSTSGRGSVVPILVVIFSLVSGGFAGGFDRFGFTIRRMIMPATSKRRRKMIFLLVYLRW